MESNTSLDTDEKQEGSKKTTSGKGGLGTILSVLGGLIIVGVVIWLFIATLPFIWWIWLILTGFILMSIGLNQAKK
jgi:hypothetical protein